MTRTLEAPQAPDLDAVKQRQQQAWASGDYHAVAALIMVVAERLVDAADLHAGWRVLDVATGSGNAAIAAARLGSDGDRLVAAKYIQRINTTGGLAPATADCNAATLGHVAEVPYTADYVFWKTTGN